MQQLLGARGGDVIVCGRDSVDDRQEITLLSASVPLHRERGFPTTIFVAADFIDTLPPLCPR